MNDVFVEFRPGRIDRLEAEIHLAGLHVPDQQLQRHLLDVLRRRRNSAEGDRVGSGGVGVGGPFDLDIRHIAVEVTALKLLVVRTRSSLAIMSRSGMALADQKHHRKEVLFPVGQGLGDVLLTDGVFVRRTVLDRIFQVGDPGLGLVLGLIIPQLGLVEAGPRKGKARAIHQDERRHLDNAVALLEPIVLPLDVKRALLVARVIGLEEDHVLGGPSRGTCRC